MTDADRLDELRVWHKERFLQAHKTLFNARSKREFWKAQAEFHRQATLLLERIQNPSLSDLDAELAKFP